MDKTKLRRSDDNANTVQLSYPLAPDTLGLELVFVLPTAPPTVDLDSRGVQSIVFHNFSGSIQIRYSPTSNNLPASKPSVIFPDESKLEQDWDPDFSEGSTSCTISVGADQIVPDQIVAANLSACGDSSATTPDAHALSEDGDYEVKLKPIPERPPRRTLRSSCLNEISMLDTIGPMPDREESTSCTITAGQAVDANRPAVAANRSAYGDSFATTPDEHVSSEDGDFEVEKTPIREHSLRWTLRRSCLKDKPTNRLCDKAEAAYNPRKTQISDSLSASLLHIIDGHDKKESCRHLFRKRRQEMARLSGQSGTGKSIPNVVRVKRIERHSGLTQAVVPPPTLLHSLCAAPFVSLDELMACWKDNPGAARIKDGQGEYPLHVLGNNDSLLSSLRGKETATAFAGHLLDKFSRAMISPNNKGNLPFFDIIIDWIDWAHENSDGHESSDDDDEKSRENRALFPRVGLWEETNWALSQISVALDFLSRDLKVPTFRRAFRRAYHEENQKLDDRSVVVESLISKIPKLLPTVLLMEDDRCGTRSRVLETILFRRMLLTPPVVDQWLTLMLSHGFIPAQRAVDFLSMISCTTIDDYTCGFGTPTDKDWKNYREARQSVYSRVSEMKGTISSLVNLNSKQMERAASTEVIWNAMSEKLARPFSIGMTMMDVFLHFCLMVAFRNEIGVGAFDEVGSPVAYNKPGTAVYVICAHCLIRLATEVVAMWTVSKSSLRGYFLDIWNFFAISGTLLALVATFLKVKDAKLYGGLNALVVGLMWLKVLGFLKVVNRDMATFILALSQILHDIRFFMIVLAVSVLMFKDMFHITVTHKDNGEYCNGPDIDSDLMRDFCSNSWTSALQVYGMLLGEFNIDNIDALPGTTILFILLTVFGVIVLLNVLIAVISDSYKKAHVSGAMLLARSRVLLVARLEALEHFLRPSDLIDCGGKEARDRLQAIGRWIILCAVLGTAVLTEVFAFYYSIAAQTFFTIILGIVLGSSIWVVTIALLDNHLRWVIPDRIEWMYDLFVKLNNMLTSAIAYYVFGFYSTSQKRVADTDDEWADPLDENSRYW